MKETKARDSTSKPLEMASSSEEAAKTNSSMMVKNNSLHPHHIRLINALAGSLSGMISAVALAPLDVVKTRLMIQRVPYHPKHFTHVPPTPGAPPIQHQHHQEFRGILGTMRHMIKTEGITSLYKGLGTNLMGYVPNWAVYFTIYESCKDRFKNSDLLKDHEHVNHMLSSMTSGFFTSFITSPIWVIKTRMQTQVEKQYRNTFHAFREIINKEGVRGLYRGLLPSLFGLIHVGVQFPVYGKYCVDF